MELDVTHMIEDSDEMPMLSGSRAELGNDAGTITWNNSKLYAGDYPLLTTDEMRDEARRFFKGFGAWSEDEIAAWSDLELDALVTQFVAGDIREMEGFETEEAYREASESGRVSGRLGAGDGGKWYFYLGD